MTDYNTREIFDIRKHTVQKPDLVFNADDLEKKEIKVKDVRRSGTIWSKKWLSENLKKIPKGLTRKARGKLSGPIYSYYNSVKYTLNENQYNELIK